MCLFNSQIKAWASPPHNWSIQCALWKWLSLPVKTLPFGTNCSLVSWRKMHLLIPPTHLFPLEHKQINEWRWIGLTSLHPRLMGKVLILTVTVSVQQKEVLIGENNTKAASFSQVYICVPIEMYSVYTDNVHRNITLETSFQVLWLQEGLWFFWLCAWFLNTPVSTALRLLVFQT